MPTRPPRSEGRKLPFAGDEVVCEVLRDGCFDGLDIVVIDVDDPLALEWAPRAAAAGARVVDNSAAFRTDADVPLVIAEVNPDDLRDMPPRHRVVPQLHHHDPAHRARAPAPGRRASSGSWRPRTSRSRAPGNPACTSSRSSGRRAPGQMERLRRAGAIEGAIEPGEQWDRPIAGNVIPLAGSVKEAGYTSEEWKFVRESRKILHAPTMRVTATCVRVPVYVGHAVAINAQFSRLLPREEAIELLATAPGVQLVDNGDGHPTPLEAAGIDPVLVGRVREDPSQARTLDLWVTGDNLRKGAALNAVQLAELLLEL